MSRGTILITGTSRGIGASLLDICLAQGWNVIACQRKIKGEIGTLRSNGDSSCHEIELDVSREDLVQKAFRSIAQSFSHIDVSVSYTHLTLPTILRV